MQPESLFILIKALMRRENKFVKEARNFMKSDILLSKQFWVQVSIKTMVVKDSDIWAVKYTEYQLI